MCAPQAQQRDLLGSYVFAYNSVRSMVWSWVSLVYKRVELSQHCCIEWSVLCNKLSCKLKLVIRGQVSLHVFEQRAKIQMLLKLNDFVYCHCGCSGETRLALDNRFIRVHKSHGFISDRLFFNKCLWLSCAQQQIHPSRVFQYLPHCWQISNLPHRKSSTQTNVRGVYQVDV